jgi:hypothetical protein
VAAYFTSDPILSFSFFVLFLVLPSEPQSANENDFQSNPAKSGHCRTPPPEPARQAHAVEKGRVGQACTFAVKRININRSGLPVRKRHAENAPT